MTNVVKTLCRKDERILEIAICVDFLYEVPIEKTFLYSSKFAKLQFWLLQICHSFNFISYILIVLILSLKLLKSISLSTFNYVNFIFLPWKKKKKNHSVKTNFKINDWLPIGLSWLHLKKKGAGGELGPVMGSVYFL